jgi:hypothetical protein
MRVTLPGQLRPTLKALVAGVASTAQEAYRRGTEERADRLRSDDPKSAETAPTRDALGLPPVIPVPFDRRLGLYWTEVESILASELADQPQVLSRVLRRLSRASTYGRTEGEADGEARQLGIAVPGSRESWAREAASGEGYLAS